MGLWEEEAFALDVGHGFLYLGFRVLAETWVSSSKDVDGCLEPEEGRRGKRRREEDGGQGTGRLEEGGALDSGERRKELVGQRGYLFLFLPLISPALRHRQKQRSLEEGGVLLEEEVMGRVQGRKGGRGKEGEGFAATAAAGHKGRER